MIWKLPVSLFTFAAHSFFLFNNLNFTVMSQIKVRGKMQRIAVINENRVVAKAVRYSTVKQDELTSYAAQSSHIPESTLRACTLAMREAISYFVLNGHHVDLGKFGILGVRSSQKAATDAEEVSANLVKRVTIGFTPSKEIKDAIAAMRIETEV